MYSSPVDIQEYLKELRDHQLELRKNLAEMTIHIANMDIAQLWIMPIPDRNMIINRHNKHIEQQKK